MEYPYEFFSIAEILLKRQGKKLHISEILEDLAENDMIIKSDEWCNEEKVGFFLRLPDIYVDVYGYHYFSYSELIIKCKKNKKDAYRIEDYVNTVKTYVRERTIYLEAYKNCANKNNSIIEELEQKALVSWMYFALMSHVKFRQEIEDEKEKELENERIMNEMTENYEKREEAKAKTKLEKKKKKLLVRIDKETRDSLVKLIKTALIVSKMMNELPDKYLDALADHHNITREQLNAIMKEENLS